MVDISKIRKGDKVTIADLEVVEINLRLDEVVVRNKGTGTLHLDAVRIVKHTPREFKVGDRVTNKNPFSSQINTVVCVTKFNGEEYLWLRDMNGLATYPSKNWVLVEE